MVRVLARKVVESGDVVSVTDLADNLPLVSTKPESIAGLNDTGL